MLFYHVISRFATVPNCQLSGWWL